MDGGRIYLTIIEVADCRYQSHSCQAAGGYYSTITAKTCVTLIVYTLSREEESGQRGETRGNCFVITRTVSSTLSFILESEVMMVSSQTEREREIWSTLQPRDR